MKLAIVGAGPVGLVSALHALNAGHEVHIYSVNDSNNSSTANKWSGELKAGKNGFAAYGEDMSFNKTSLNHLFIESKIRGGFANVWGATWGQFVHLNSPEWQYAYGQVDRYVWSSNPLGPHWTDLPFAEEFQCTCFKASTQKIVSKNTKTARFAKLAILHHECNCLENGDTRCDHESIFDTTNLLKNCEEFELFRLFESIKVESFASLEHGVQLSPNVRNSVYDKIVLAAGPIANTKIIINSDPEIVELVIRDNAMIYVPLINLFRKMKHSGSFAFSQIQISSSPNSPLQFHQQIYAHPELFIDRITSSVPDILRPAARKFVKIASGRINIGIVYLDEKISSKVSIDRNLKLKLVKPGAPLGIRKRVSLNYGIWRNFLEVGFFWFWPISKKGLPGASFHVGALEGDFLDSYGQIIANSRVGVAGSLCLERLEPGPITNTSMAQAIRLIERIL